MDQTIARTHIQEAARPQKYHLWGLYFSLITRVTLATLDEVAISTFPSPPKPTTGNLDFSPAATVHGRKQSVKELKSFTTKKVVPLNR